MELVKAAAQKAVADRLLLAEDAEKLISQAEASDVAVNPALQSPANANLPVAEFPHGVPIATAATRVRGSGSAKLHDPPI